MFRIKNPQFIKSTLDWRDAPKPALSELAFVGRSNVGKSSLINSLLGRKNFARVSKQPGKTRTINYFLIDEAFYLVDLPGYGYAKISKAEKKAWQTAIEAYLLKSKELQLLFLLIDGKVGAKDNDIQIVEWLKYNRVPFVIVATKIDKVPKSKRPARAAAILRDLGLNADSQIFLCSAKDNTGRGGLTSFIGQLLNHT